MTLQVQLNWTGTGPVTPSGTAPETTKTLRLQGLRGKPSTGLEPVTPSLPSKRGGFTGFPGVREVR